MYGVSLIAKRTDNDAMSIAITDMENEIQIVILNACHCETT